MASTTFIKNTGVLHLLLLGLLLSSVRMGTSTTESSTDTNTPSLTTNSSTTVTTNNTTAVVGSTGTTLSSSSTTSTATAASSSTSSPSATGPVTTQFTVATSSSPVNTSTNTTVLVQQTNMTKIRCPSFTCNHSDCYTMYNSRNFTECDPGAYCQLKKQMGVHTVSCSTSCSDNCTASLTNCSVTCCNFTGCLNDSFTSMMTTTTVVPTTKITTTTTTTTTTTPQTTANNGNKCYKGTCTDTDCYTSFKNMDLQICSSSEKHCQLKKDTVDSKVQWTAGCTTNCSAQTPCKTSTQPPCHLECCNATVTSCLWLNGTLNFPSSATRGPYVHTELITCILCLFAMALML